MKHIENKSLFIVVAGAIAVGKSTASRILAEKIGARMIEETVDNHPTLTSFYTALGNYQNNPEIASLKVKCHYESFRTQSFFLWDRFDKHIEAIVSNKKIVADRSIYEDIIFAELLTDRGEMSASDFSKIYYPHAQKIMGFLRPPDLTIILEATTATLMARKAKRDREMECSIPFSYMEDLNNKYKKWARSFPYTKIIVNTEDKDFTSADSDAWEDLISNVKGNIIINNN